MKRTFLSTASAAAAMLLVAAPAAADQVFNDDVIVSFSLCVGNDCVNGESFGFDTIRMKENNTRLHFDDTSTSASFPRNDWRLVANDSNNGGASFLAIEDATLGRRPFRVEAGAPANALVVEDDGDIGIKTINPVVDIHVVEGNTPTLRLEQDGSDGFAPQTWDIAGNEGNFFVRDVTNGSRLPFKIKPGAPSDALFVAADGDVGVGAGTSPSAALHVRRTNGTSGILVEDTNTTSGNLTLMQLENFGGRPRLQMTGSGGNATQQGDWSMSAGDTFVIQDRTTSTNVMIIDGTGNVTITGTLTQGSDRDRKSDVIEVDGAEILDRIAALPISEWSYTDEDVRHIGPMAQDFHALFQVGASDVGLSSLDTSGVALAAIKALDAENSQLRDRIERLERALAR